jgi:hypothetical protein
VRWESVTRAVSHMRDKRLSLQRAADEAQLPPALLKRLAGSAIKKGANGRYVATKYDRLLRVLLTPATDGMREVATRDSREASKLSRYSHALELLLHGKDAKAITAFESVRVRMADGSTISLLTNIEDIRRLANAGVLSFESIYAKR